MEGFVHISNRANIMVVAVVSKPARKKIKACAAASSMVRVVPAGGGGVQVSVSVYDKQNH